jgi:16S rRNA (guanine966-N2)-methyltransferase
MKAEIRIGGGEFKGRRIYSSGGDYRPTTAIVKKSLFDTIAEDVDNCRFLDLFAGCGAVGLEALSRGAEYVCFVDNDLARIDVLKKNIELLKIPKSSTKILGMDYSEALHLLRSRSERFDFIYVDPPYSGSPSVRILGDLSAAQVLDEDGLIIYESIKKDARKIAESAPETLYPTRERVLSGTALISFRWRAGCSPNHQVSIV